MREAADAAWRAGRGAQTDLFVARSALARLDDQRLQAEGPARPARAPRCGAGSAPAAERPLADAPPLALRSRLATRPTPALLDADPELQLAAAREAAAARRRADLALQERRADWSVDLRFAQRGPRFDNMLTVGLSLPLRWDPANRQDREVAARAGRSCGRPGPRPRSCGARATPNSCAGSSAGAAALRAPGRATTGRCCRWPASRSAGGAGAYRAGSGGAAGGAGCARGRSRRCAWSACSSNSMPPPTGCGWRP